MTTTQLYLEDHPEEIIRRVRQHLDDLQRSRPFDLPVAGGYDAADLGVLFGESPR